MYWWDEWLLWLEMDSREPYLPPTDIDRQWGLIAMTIGLEMGLLDAVGSKMRVLWQWHPKF